MSLIPVVGGWRSNSFITVSEATSILTASPVDTTEWSAVSTPDKEQRLILAARAMATLSFRGYRVYEEQALCFPRTCQPDVTVIPTNVKEAQALIAWLVIHRGLVSLSSPNEGTSGSPVTSVSLGGLLSVSFATSPAPKGSSLDEAIVSEYFPVYMALVEYLTPLRIMNGDRPVKLPRVA